MKRQTFPRNPRKWQGGFAAMVSAGVALYGAYEGSQKPSTSPSSSAQAAADPFASQRQQYQGQLQTLMSNPGSVTANPAYQAALNAGSNNVQRTNAAAGMGTSGNEQAALYQYGLTFEQQAYQQQEQDLAQLAGATIGSPGVAGQINQQNTAATSAAEQQLLGKAVDGIGNVLDNSSTFGDLVMGGSM